jgi:uncharacterized coiled-coil protein SlyX
VTVNGQDPMQRLSDEVTGLSHQMGEFVLWQGRLDARQGRLENRMNGLDTRMDHLESDVAELKVQVNGLERSTQRGFNRLDAQLERLITLVKRAETR